MLLTPEQAQEIVRKHVPEHAESTVCSLAEIENRGLSYTRSSCTYMLDLADATSSRLKCSFFLTIAEARAENTGVYHSNSLEVVDNLLNLIRTQTEIPIPKSILDTSQALVPYHFLLSPLAPIISSDMVTLTEARRLGVLDARVTLLVELALGKYLGQLHSNVQNDWYGPPSLSPPSDPSYNWQETFTSLLESLLSRTQSRGIDLPYEDLRRYLSRAIGFFLFDDVEVPSLIWFTGSEDDIYVTIPSAPKPPTIAAILPSVAHAMWGDPLLESYFMPPGPSTAMIEGYVGSGGGPLTPFARQKTKRLWYTLFVSLLVLEERANGSGSADDEKIRWAQETLNGCVQALKDAPCY
ncbi:hypothetical protein BD779DRAFT_1446218 [Infundibulicybe gibba]|nr:hypothetical protein BD779DRAFT_1446218 [Infundibulicybe gibba]